MSRLTWPIVVGVALLLGGLCRFRSPEVFVPVVDTPVRGIDTRGGTVGVGGVSVTVPEGALASSERIAISSEPALPGPLPPGTIATSPVVVLTKTTAAPFSVPVSVTVPCSNPESSCALYWDPEHRIYRSLTVTALGPGTLTFETLHFTEFLTASSDLSTVSVDTGFRPDADGFPYRNGGFDLDVEGWCFGISSLSVWYYETHGVNGEHLAAALAASRNGPVTSDAASMEMARLAQDETTATLKAKKSALAHSEFATHRLGDKQAGLALLNALAATHMPQLMFLQTWGQVGHAVVVYGYEKGHFLIYDSNYPGETLTYGFDLAKGFGTYGRGNGGKLDAVYSQLPFYSWLALSSIGSDADFQKIFDQALADTKSLSPIRVLIDAPVVDASGTAHVPADAKTLTISGRVEGGEDFVRAVMGTDKKTAHPRVLVAIEDGAAAFSSDARLGDGPETAFSVNGKLDKIQDAIRRAAKTKKGTTVDHFTVAIYLSSAKVGNGQYDENVLGGRELLRFAVVLEPATTTPGILGALDRQ